MNEEEFGEVYDKLHEARRLDIQSIIDGFVRGMEVYIDTGTPLPELLSYIKQSFAYRYVGLNGGNRTAAARDLQINRGTLRKYLERDK